MKYWDCHGNASWCAGWPYFGFKARNKRKLGWGFRILGCPSTVPASLSKRLPSGSSRGFKRSRTVGLQRFALSSRTQWPSIIALVSVPSIHSNLQGRGYLSHQCSRISTRTKHDATCKQVSSVFFLSGICVPVTRSEPL